MRDTGFVDGDREFKKSLTLFKTSIKRNKEGEPTTGASKFLLFVEFCFQNGVFKIDWLFLLRGIHNATYLTPTGSSDFVAVAEEARLTMLKNFCFIYSIQNIVLAAL